MGTAFNKGRRNKSTSATNNSTSHHKSHGSKNSSSYKNNVNNASLDVSKNVIIKPYTGSSSSISHNQQHNPYLSTLNPNNIEINTGLTSSLIPSNSKSTSSYNNAKGTPQPQRPVRNNTTDKHLNTLSMHKKLTFGWIRENCIQCNDNININNNNNNDDDDDTKMQPQISQIPQDILETCFEFMYIERILFCFIASEHDKISTLQALDVNNIYKSQYQLKK